jgi:hypothetical protein
MPLANSYAFDTIDAFDTIYVAVVALTIMTPIRYSELSQYMELLGHLGLRRVCRRPNLRATLSMWVNSIYGPCFGHCSVPLDH